MAWKDIALVPGVNTQKTLSLNEAGVSQSQLIRYKDGLIQTYGGCQQYVSYALPSTARDIHPWMDNSGTTHLGIGATQNLSVITNGSNVDITPQTITSSLAPNFSITASSFIVTVTDPNSGPTIYNSVYFNTPVNVGGVVLNGAYQIQAALSTGSYTIYATANASVGVTSSGILPSFTTTANSAVVSVDLTNNGYQAITGLYQQFIAPTSVGGLTIQGPYQVSSVIDTTRFTITATQPATTAATATMNGGLAQLIYYITQGPVTTGSGFGAGGFGSGGFGTGTGTTGSAGTPITTTDWTLENWGGTLLACPKDGPLYAWSGNSGFKNAQVVAEAPFFNGGIFVSQPQQILVLWRSCQSTGVQDPLIVRWSDALDYTNYTVSNQTAAGSFHIPTGSKIVGGIQAATLGIISTDIEVWVMQYIGGDLIFNFTRVGNGCGWIGPHAAGIMNGIAYWCGQNSFYMLSGGGVIELPCTVWDKIFQNINSTYETKVKCAVNSQFNEIAWFYPSAASTGENDSYVKAVITPQGPMWDYGTLSRTAWTDASILGEPIGIDSQGYVWQHESGTVVPGVASPSFQTGWWAISNGEDFAFVDFVVPDMKWGLYSGAQDAQVNITFYAVDYPGDTPRTYGPYTVSQTTEYINTRIRGRLMSALVTSANTEFWRLGRIRYRWAQSGRR